MIAVIARAAPVVFATLLLVGVLISSSSRPEDP
jgi:hypothetical protein